MPGWVGVSHCLRYPPVWWQFSWIESPTRVRFIWLIASERLQIHKATFHLAARSVRTVVSQPSLDSDANILETLIDVQR